MFSDRASKSRVAHLKVGFMVTIFRRMGIETERDEAFVRDKIIFNNRLSRISGPYYGNEHGEGKVGAQKYSLSTISVPISRVT